MVKSNRSLWVVTTSGDRSIWAVGRDLAAAGFHAVEVMEVIGCITGHADAKTLPQLRAVAGVRDISPSQPIYIGPPDSAIS